MRFDGADVLMLYLVNFDVLHGLWRTLLGLVELVIYLNVLDLLCCAVMVLLGFDGPDMLITVEFGFAGLLCFGLIDLL